LVACARVRRFFLSHSPYVTSPSGLSWMPRACRSFWLRGKVPVVRHVEGGAGEKLRLRGIEAGIVVLTVDRRAVRVQTLDLLVADDIPGRVLDRHGVVDGPLGLRRPERRCCAVTWRDSWPACLVVLRLGDEPLDLV
jgi:hypothetical protein